MSKKRDEVIKVGSEIAMGAGNMYGSAVGSPQRRTPPGYEAECLAIRIIVMRLVAEIASQHAASGDVTAQDYVNRFSDDCQKALAASNIEDSDLRGEAIKRVNDIFGRILYPPGLDKFS